MQVSLRKVTSQYLQGQKIKARKKYDVVPHPMFADLGHIIAPNGGRLTIRIGGKNCAHLETNEIKKWTVHRD